MLPPRRPPPPRPLAPAAATTTGEDERWAKLDEPARRRELHTLWRNVCAMYLEERPDEERFLAALSEKLASGASREALERWVCEDVAARRGRSIGPIGPRGGHDGRA
jgi:hypothetical protein